MADNMDIFTLASGSSGNCYRVSDGHTPLLIECGISFPEIRKGCGFKLSEIAGCLCSHEHGDHCKAIKDIIKAGIDCYMTPGTAQEIGIHHHRINTVQPLQNFKIGTWTVLPFPAQHDAVEPVGFLMASGSEKLLYLTDSFYCRYKFKDLTHIMIETNYAADILAKNIEAGIVAPEQKKRILRSHFSLENVKEFLRANDLSRVQEIHLIHISKDSGHPEMFIEDIQKLTGKPVYVA
jgi:phosphoribosyl 1,2-cyclic phosphodiesterase